jgi:hypothetical protein
VHLQVHSEHIACRYDVCFCLESRICLKSFTSHAFCQGLALPGCWRCAARCRL